MIRRLARKAMEKAHSVSESLLNSVSTPLVVLIFHRVTELASDPQMLAVRPMHFRQQLLALKSHFDVLRFEAPWVSLRRPTVVLTFDDGYADNLHEALPILEETGVPATFFIATGYVGRDREFWWDELERSVLLGDSHGSVQKVGPIELPEPYDCRSATGRGALYRRIHPLIKKLSIPERELALSDLASVMHPPSSRDSHRVLSVTELQQLAASPMVTIGAHTVHHQPLSSLSRQIQRHEIEQSRAELASWIGGEVSVFSYPFGNRADYGPEAVDMCREIGFVKVASNFPAVVRRWTDPYQVPRFLVRDWTGEELLRRLRFFAGL